MIETTEPRDTSDAPVEASATGTLDDQRRAVLDQLRETSSRISQAKADRLRFTVEFALLHPAGTMPAGHPQGEKAVALDTDGCPLVAEFAPMEFAARMQMRPEAAVGEISIALAIRYRLPLIWNAVMGLRLPVHVAQRLASATMRLSKEVCLELGRELGRMVGHTSGKRLVAHAKARVFELLSDEASDDHARALAQRHVEVCREDHVSHLTATLSHADGLWLNARLDQIATILGRAGDTDSREVRRSKALGVLASPARALQLLQADVTDPHTSLFDEPAALACPAAGQRGHTCGQVTVDPDKLLPTADLVVHLTDATARDSAGLVRAENLGPQLAGWVKDLVGHARGRVRPVFDPSRVHPVDHYEIPAAMREAVTLRNPTSVFPYSTRRSKGLDHDHTIPHREGGPPGQTNVGNLGPLTRREHRTKTHSRWRVHQSPPGVFDWTSPLGYRYLVTPSGTRELTGLSEDEIYDVIEPLIPRETWSAA